MRRYVPWLALAGALVLALPVATQPRNPYARAIEAEREAAEIENAYGEADVVEAARLDALRLCSSAHTIEGATCLREVSRMVRLPSNFSEIYLDAEAMWAAIILGLQSRSITSEQIDRRLREFRSKVLVRLEDDIRQYGTLRVVDGISTLLLVAR